MTDNEFKIVIKLQQKVNGKWKKDLDILAEVDFADFLASIIGLLPHIDETDDVWLETLKEKLFDVQGKHEIPDKSGVPSVKAFEM